MAAIARDYIDVILRMTGEKTDFSDAPNSAYSRAMLKLNEYLEVLRERGCTLNATQYEIENMNQSVNFPNYARSAIESNVAVMLWDIVNPNTMISPMLEKKAKNSQAVLMYRHGPSRNMKYPSTMPRGSGNTGTESVATSTFYPDYDPEMYPG